MSAHDQAPANRVFLLGSGFSAAMGHPTLRTLFGAIMGQEGPDKTEVLAALEHLYPHFDPNAQVPAYPPFEEFLSLVAAAEDFREHYEEGYWIRKRLSALRLLTDSLASQAETAEEDPLLHQFAQGLNGGDTVITFNWDTLVERALLSVGKNVNFKERDSNAISVLKLHGSLSWAEIPEGRSLTELSSVHWLASNVCYPPDFRYYDLWDQLGQPPFIVPPISFKRLPAESILQDIWYTAFNALVEASSVTVIGYSIPPEDLQARALLRSALLANEMQYGRSYKVLDPDPSIGSRYFEQVSPRLRYLQGYFSADWLSELFSTT